MEILLGILVGMLYATGLYMMLRRSLVKIIIGLILLGNGANLMIFLLGRLTKGAPPIIDEGMNVLTAPFADPVPQALILTAIVISFGLQAFAIVLMKRVYEVVGTDDIDRINMEEGDL
jgi:multicomponent Na+:H+ antiporter subunit C